MLLGAYALLIIPNPIQLLISIFCHLFSFIFTYLHLSLQLGLGGINNKYVSSYDID